MKRFASVASLLFILPFFAHAEGLQLVIANLIGFVNKTLIPFLLGIAFLIFAFNAIRFFVFQGASEDGRKNAKNLAIYGVLAFVIILVFWGIVNLLSSSIGLQSKTSPTPDYVKLQGAEFNSPPTGTNNSPCTDLQQQFDNSLGGPCATNGNTTPGSSAAQQNNKTTGSATQNSSPTSGSDPQNILPPVFGGPAENFQTCPAGTVYSESSLSCVSASSGSSASMTGGTGGSGSSGGGGSGTWSNTYNDYNDTNNNSNTSSANSAPRKPTVNGSRDNSGASYRSPNSDLTFTLQTTDPDGDSVFFHIEWSDASTNNNLPTMSSSVPSGSPTTVTRKWSTSGTYTFRVRAIDNNDKKSDWTTHTVYIYESSSSSSGSQDIQYFDSYGNII